MSTNTSLSDKSDGTNLSNDDEQPVIDQLKAAIRGPDAQCGNGPVAVIAYAERQSTADFREAADALKRMIDRGDVVRTDGSLQLVETDGGVPEGDADELDRRAQAAARALLKYAEATGQRPEWLLTYERCRESEDGVQIVTDGGLVDACPECESSTINQRIGRQYDADERYLCLDCRHTFAEPIQREPIRHKGSNYSAAGAALREADDLDDLRADGTGTIELSGSDRLNCVRGSAHVEGVSEVFEDSFADHELSVGTGYSDAGAFLNLVYEDGDVEIDLGAVLTPEGARALATALEVLAETAEER